MVSANPTGTPLERYEALKAPAEVAYAAWRTPERARIDVAIDTSSLANGAKATRAAIAARIQETNATVDLGQNHGYGMQWLQPLVTITFPDGASVVYGPVKADQAAAIVDIATGRTPATSTLAIGAVAGTREGIPSLRDHPFFALEPKTGRRLIHRLGLTDPENMQHYLGTGGYHAAARMLDRHQSPAQVRQDLIDSALGGRGGGNFPAGTKWNFLATAPGDEHYVICNADEGDPGAWVNRVIMEGDPHLLIEGLLIAAYATGSRGGFIYVRDEYPLAIARLEAAVREAEAAGLLGNGVLGTSMNFELRVIRGAGAYVCGEETGLINSIQDGRGMPRVKPPFPAGSGVFFKPSNVNNVETYANAPTVVEHGAQWYLEYGTERMRGTRLFSFSGDIQRVGFMEIPFGVPLAGVIEACGGMLPGQQLKAIQSGGPLGSMLPAREVPNLSMENVPFSALDALMGGGGIVFLGDQVCTIHMAEMFTQFVEEESCGRCTTCHGGNQRQTEIIRRTIAGDGRHEDRHNLALIDRTLQFSNCVHGQFSPKIVRNTLRFFSEEYERHSAGRTCDALECEGLIRFRVTNQSDPRLVEAQEICPTAAIIGGPGARRVDDALCIRCGACTDVAPNALVREAKPATPRVVAIS
ncbi:MAG: NADH-quinone oxidoreductase subunit F [Chloroflexi bacterium]|nr:MAG: NADH-quinone oxidoreductase subunit F [Chloroflexota bacterium]